MRKTKIMLMVAGITALAMGGVSVPRVVAEQALLLKAHDGENRPLIQVALLLDTSNSMDGLIDQARTQLWTIVNEFARCKREGRTPRLQVALYEYGNDSLSARSGHVRLVQPFTGDLDLVSEKLWGLKTNGGSEFCGTVIRDAAKELSWADAGASLDRNVYRAIFIAGNEPFTQGSVDYRSATGMAVGKGIVVNTIHCGADDAGRSGQWADGARLGEGSYMTINQDRVIRGIIAPQDEKIQKLSLELNETYIPYGDAGGTGVARQAAQDSVMTSAPSAVAANAGVDRAVAKAQEQYNNAGWDLVDALKEGKEDLKMMKDEALPAAIRELPAAERETYVKEKASKRAEIQKEINQLNDERAKFVAEEQRKQTGGDDTLNSAVIKVVQEQLKARDFEVAETK